MDSNVGLSFRLCCVAALLVTAGCQEKTAVAAAAPPLDTAQLAKQTLNDLVKIPGGEFQMGDFGPLHSEEKLPYTPEADDGPLHPVKLGAFSMLNHKVTVGEYAVFARETGVPHPYAGPRQSPGQQIVMAHPQGKAFPVNVDWADARNYCQWLGKVTALSMDLPTEAEWEFAARNRGAMVMYPTDSGDEKSGVNFASYEQAQKISREPGMDMPVNAFPPSPLGLFDMAANGTEWVKDWYAEDYYKRSPADNPQGPDTGIKKVIRSANNGEARPALAFARGASLPKSPQDQPAGWNSHAFRCVAH